MSTSSFRPAFILTCALWAVLSILSIYFLGLGIIVGLVGASVIVFSFVPYLVSWLLYTFTLGPQDLKKKYKTNWALITGASSGIGKAAAHKMARQGVNVVLVAFPDATLEQTAAEMGKQYPELKFVKVGVDLSEVGCIDNVKEATKDLDIGIVFSNAGYICTGLFTTVTEDKQMRNYHCNATSSAQLGHYFALRMQTDKRPGAIIFTSSPAAFMPCPFGVMYGATKAFITEFACSLAPEVREDGIDICVVHPSPVSTNFYQNAGNLSSLQFFKNTAVGPEVIVDAMLRTVGRFIVCDQGWYSTALRSGLKLLDSNFLADLVASFAFVSQDYQDMRKAAASSSKK